MQWLSSDKHKTVSNFDFDLFLFVELFFAKFSDSKSRTFEIEELDNFLYISFVESINKEKEKLLIKKSRSYGCKWTRPDRKSF